MSYIVDFLQSIWGAIQTVYFFIVNMVEGIVNFFKLIPTFISYLTSAINGLPDFLVVFAMAMIGIAIVHVIIEVT